MGGAAGPETSHDWHGEREMTQTLEVKPARRPLERCVPALSGDGAVRASTASVTAVAGPRGEAPTP
jgi:hypothetical protein